METQTPYELKRKAEIPYGYCQCGCGNLAPIATYTNKRLGYKKGIPVRFILCHWMNIKKGNFKDRHGANSVNWKGGISLKPLYYTWDKMVKRCTNTKDKYYPDYGGRGIKVCEEWLDINAFIEWGESSGWNVGLEIDRIDNDNDYYPQNCRFVKRIANAQNTRKSKIWHIESRSYPSLRYAAKGEGVSTHTIWAWCNGGIQHGIYYPPKTNCWSEKLYK